MDARLDTPLVPRAFGLVFLHKRPKRVLINDRIHRFPHRLIGMRQGRIGSFIEQAVLATDGSDILHQFFDDAAFRRHRDFVNHLDEQIHQAVNDLLPPFPAKDGYQRRALRLRMSTDFSQRFLTHAQAIGV